MTLCLNSLGCNGQPVEGGAWARAYDYELLFTRDNGLALFGPFKNNRVPIPKMPIADFPGDGRFMPE
jgi:hypothetical protein